MPTFSRLLAAITLAPGLAGLSLPARAVDAPAIKTSPRKVVLDNSLPADPLDQLRDRLATRLGVEAEKDKNPSVLQVPVRVTAGGAAVAAGQGAASSRRAAARKASSQLAWSYEGDAGPEHWGRLRPEFSRCGTGNRQSPIDIRDGISVQLDPVQFDYKSSAFGVVDNGRTVQVNVAPGNAIEVMGRKFELVSFDFQRPSEERINGRQFDMGVHLVHKDAAGRMAVVAVLLDRGQEQAVIQSVWNNLPLEKNEELRARSGLNPAELLPADRRYFTYMGSMTTPPCKEGVLWMVMKNPVGISTEQLDVFARLYRMNARPVQSVGGRLIKGP